MLWEGSVRTALCQGPGVPTVSKSPRKSSPSVAALPPTLFSWHWARESVPNIKEVPQKGSFCFTPHPHPSPPQEVPDLEKGGMDGDAMSPEQKLRE